MAKDIGIDLGTSDTIIFVKGKGIKLREASVVAVNTRTGVPVAIGNKAEKMIGRTPDNIKAIRPIQDGVIADFKNADVLIRYCLENTKGFNGKTGSTKMLIAVPSGITEVEQLAIIEAVKNSGSGIKPRLVEKSLAAAIGAGVNLSYADTSGSLVLNIGAGTTEIAIISMGNLYRCTSIKIASNNFDNAIINYLKSEYNLLVGESTAERIKKEIGTVYPKIQEVYSDARGRDLLTGMPTSIKIKSTELIEALREPVMQIIGHIKTMLLNINPEIAADIAAGGIVLTGGGSLLGGLAEVMRIETNIPVRLAENPDTCVAEGLGACLSESGLKSILARHTV